MAERDSKRLAKISEKLEYMKAQQKDILAKEKKRQGQARTRRLIQIGAIIEKYFDMKDIGVVEFEEFLKIFIKIENIDKCVLHTKHRMLNSENISTDSETKMD